MTEIFLPGYGGSSKSTNSFWQSAVSTITFFIFIPFLLFLLCACVPIFFKFYWKRKSQEILEVELGGAVESRSQSIDRSDDPPPYEEGDQPPGYEAAIRLPQIH